MKLLTPAAAFAACWLVFPAAALAASSAWNTILLDPAACPGPQGVVDSRGNTLIDLADFACSATTASDDSADHRGRDGGEESTGTGAGGANGVFSGSGFPAADFAHPGAFTFSRVGAAGGVSFAHGAWPVGGGWFNPGLGRSWFASGSGGYFGSDVSLSLVGGASGWGWSVAIVSVPEPSTWAMTAFGFLALSLAIYRRRATPHRGARLASARLGWRGEG